MFLPAWDGATRGYSTFCTGTGHLLCLLFSQNASSRPAQYKQVAVDLGRRWRDYVKPGRFAGLDIYGLAPFCFGCRSDVRGARSALCQAPKQGGLPLPTGEPGGVPDQANQLLRQNSAESFSFCFVCAFFCCCRRHRRMRFLWRLFCSSEKRLVV